MSLPGTRIQVPDDVAGPLEFNVVDQGTGDPVLLLHGFPDSAEVWREQIKALTAAGYRVLVPDLRGFGDSAAPRGADPDQDVELYRLTRVVTDLGAMLKVMGVAPPVHVVGHDWGSAVAWTLASLTKTQPLVRSLTVMSVGHPRAYKRPSITQRERSWYIYFFQHPRAEAALARDERFLVEWSRYPYEVPRWRADLQRPGRLTAALNWYRANASPDPARSIVDLIPTLEAQGAWGPVRVPTLGLCGTEDPHLTTEAMMASGQFVDPPTHWQYQDVPAGHWLQLQQADLVNKLLLGFLGPL